MQYVALASLGKLHDRTKVYWFERGSGGNQGIALRYIHVDQRGVGGTIVSTVKSLDLQSLPRYTNVSSQHLLNSNRVQLSLPKFVPLVQAPCAVLVVRHSSITLLGHVHLHL